jgi:hypothetical protein
MAVSQRKGSRMIVDPHLFQLYLIAAVLLIPTERRFA